MKIQSIQNNTSYGIQNRYNSPSFQKLIVKDAKKFPTEILEEAVHDQTILNLTDYFSADKIDVTIKYVKRDGERYVETYAGMNGYCDVLEFSDNIKEFKSYNPETDYEKYGKSVDRQTKKSRKQQFRNAMEFVKSFNKGLKN